jgi:transcriptional regulator with XRE-family HTH domain
MDIQKIVGTNIKNIRETKNLSQEKLADLSDLDRTYIFSIEKGRRNISIKVLFKIAKALEVSILELVKDLEDGI